MLNERILYRVMTEYGGYLPLEMNEKGGELYSENNDYTVWRLNCGRSAIVAALKSCEVGRVFIPYYNCHVVETALQKYGYTISKYKIDRNFMPLLDSISENDWIVYTDYFGICTLKTKEEIIRKYRNVIFDNTQAFFSDPIIKKGVFNVYSCRKFFGVSDGAYVISNRKTDIDNLYNKDFSWERCAYLIKSYELGTNGAYGDSLQSEESIGYEIKLMSDFTRIMMQFINYETVRVKRNKNFNYLVEQFADINDIKLKSNESTAPMIYPLLVYNDELRTYLIQKKIYVPQWWKYLIDTMKESDFEVELSKYLIPLPIDQRYSLEDMNDIVNIIRAKCENK